jgi:hypothetical protein
MKNMKLVIPVLAALAFGACEDMNIIDPNQPTLTSLTDAPTPASIAVATQGLFVSMIGSEPGFSTTAGTLGREYLSLNSQEPRPYSELLKGPLDPASRGADAWATHYTTIRLGNIILTALDQVTGMTDQQKNGIRGFVKTWQAVNLAHVIDMRANNGAVIDPGADPFGEPGPLEPEAKVQDAVMALFNEAITALGNAGPTFAFRFPTTGWTGFNTPANFVKVAQALKARHAVHFKRYADAKTAVNASFIDAAGALDLGPTWFYTTAPGETTNPIFRTQVNYAHRSFVTQAEMKAGTGVCNIDAPAACDDRVGRNVFKTAAKTLQESTSDLYFRRWDDALDPYPVVRNEELILNRAEIAISEGNIAQAISDINLIRTRSGGLSARTDLNATNILDELIRQRHYSLFMEGDRWLTLRRYNRLSAIPKDAPNHIIIQKYPIPHTECLARGFEDGRCSGPGASGPNVLP